MKLAAKQPSVTVVKLGPANVCRDSECFSLRGNEYIRIRFPHVPRLGQLIQVFEISTPLRAEVQVSVSSDSIRLPKGGGS